VSRTYGETHTITGLKHRLLSNASYLGTRMAAQRPGVRVAQDRVWAVVVIGVFPVADDHAGIGAANVIFRQPETRAHLGVCQFLIQSAIDQLDQQLYYSRINETVIGNRPGRSLSRFIHSSEPGIGYKPRADAIYQLLRDTTTRHFDIPDYRRFRGHRRTSIGFSRTYSRWRSECR
jgi:hypothetical protein